MWGRAGGHRPGRRQFARRRDVLGQERLPASSADRRPDAATASGNIEPIAHSEHWWDRPDGVVGGGQQVDIVLVVGLFGDFWM